MRALRQELATDAALLSKVADGDQASFDELYRRHREACLSACRRVTASYALAEEAMQSAFLDVWRQAARYRPDRASARVWILTIAHHKAVDVVRVEQRRWQALPGASSDLVTQETDPTAAVDSSDELGHVFHVIRALTPTQRECLMLCYYAGYTQREVADRLGVPLGTVKTRCLRALQVLRQALDADAPGGQPVAR